MPRTRVEVYRAADRARDDAPPQEQWRFRLIAGNGEIVESGEAYASKANALRGVETLKALWQANPVIVAVE